MGNSSFTDSKNRSAGISYNEIMKFAVCVDNMDPRRAGRIRAIKNDGEGITSGKVNDPVKAIIKLDSNAIKNKKYLPWSLDDPYVFAPFLPLQINVIPRKGEAVKILAYETEKKQNEEYIGPLISQPGSIQGDNFSSGLLNTSEGIQNTPPPDFAPNGVPLPDGKGCFPNPDDIALVGRDNCDIVLGMREKSIIDTTEDPIEDWYPQIMIRSGKLLKNADFTSRPTFNSKQTFIQLNTFPQTMISEEKEVEKTKTDDAILQTLIEYHFDQIALTAGNLSGYITVNKMPIEKDFFMAGKFTNDTTVTSQQKTEACRLTFNNIPNKEHLTKIINEFILQIDTGSWSKVIAPISGCNKTFNTGVDLNNPRNVGNFLQSTHPLYFRPTKSSLALMLKPPIIDDGSGGSSPLNFTTMQSTVNDIAKLIILEGVKDNPSFGLAFTSKKDKRDVPTEKIKELENTIKKQEIQQGIISAGAEKIYLFSYNSTELEGGISLNTNYGITQEKFVSEIEGKTNSLVRGEKLVELLTKVVGFVVNHTHAFPGMAPVPQAFDGSTTQELTSLLLNAPNTILNQNIRIN
tara:strand:- start:1592 stop:3316 length:1725 start_codon:yes stop_codon:yes gene_type:complete